MNTKIKTFIAIGAFALFIIIASMAYNSLAKNYKLDSSLNLTDKNVSNEKEENSTDEGKEQEEGNNELFPAPDFTMLDINGNEIKLSDFFGKPIVLNFWASWCPPCKSEMPHFDKVYNELKDDVVFMMVDSVDGGRETIEKGKKFINDNGYSFPIYFDENNEYGISALPTTIFIDKNGNIVTGWEGAMDEETLLEGINFIIEK